jgi:hypothetical protein
MKKGYWATPLIQVLNQTPTIIQVTSITRSGYLQHSFIISGTFFAGRVADAVKAAACFLRQPELSVNSRAEYQRLLHRRSRARWP